MDVGWGSSARMLSWLTAPGPMTTDRILAPEAPVSAVARLLRSDMVIPKWEAWPVLANPVDPISRLKSVACDGVYGFSKPKYDKKTCTNILVESWMAGSDVQTRGRTPALYAADMLTVGNGLDQGG